MQRARGQGGVTTKQRDGTTHLDTLYQDGCAKIRLPHTHSSALEAVLINTAGGLTGDDHMQWRAEIARHGRAVLTTQACERIYRSIGGPARVETRLAVGAHAHLDWLPQETILFAASQLDRRIDIDLAEGASLTAIEAVLLGRDAMGEEALDARLRDNWRVRRNGHLLHAEATRLDGTASERSGLSLLAGKRAFATILHVAPDADACATRLAQVRALLPADGRIAASANGERLIVRALAQTGLALRRLIVPILAELSGAGALPRLWHL
ncbi:urease accessory protein UreD [Devosia sp. SL43]|uniref:urease accessory protein UreD n=1 Tax=Devosia sp. SL43 TaxID=2806348 RepID=UPI001F03008B|nr:urease accessory protein UreD [Devosia sp. SL43]UJW86864.1 urease accessory protein UreD [Devosia sp. SL43]